MSKLITSLCTALKNRRVYRSALDEIAKFDDRDLADLNVDREMLIANAHRRVFGVAR